MRRTMIATATAVLLSSAASAQPPVPKPPAPQPQTGSGNSMVAITYVAPKNPAHEVHYNRLRKREVLEQYRQFLAPIRLPRMLTVRLQSCGSPNAFYGKSTVTVCWEFLELTRSRAPRGATAEGVTVEDAIISGFVTVLMHETSHAIFDMLQIPIMGREEDAADQLTGFVLLHFGRDLARRMIAAKAHLWDAAGSRRRPRIKGDYADTHGTEYQRFYNILCIAYGHDPATFADYVTKKILPSARAARCRTEYRKMEHAFQTLLMPHIDREAMERVRKVEWLRPGDGRP